MTLGDLLNIQGLGDPTELLFGAEPLTREVNRGWRRTGLKGQTSASATTAMVTAGEQQLSESPNQGHSIPPGDRTVHIPDVAAVWAGRGSLSTRRHDGH
jgi:hypothetical protein